MTLPRRLSISAMRRAFSFARFAAFVFRIVELAGSTLGKRFEIYDTFILPDAAGNLFDSFGEFVEEFDLFLVVVKICEI